MKLKLICNGHKACTMVFINAFQRFVINFTDLRYRNRKQFQKCKCFILGSSENFPNGNRKTLVSHKI